MTNIYKICFPELSTITVKLKKNKNYIKEIVVVSRVYETVNMVQFVNYASILHQKITNS